MYWHWKEIMSLHWKYFEYNKKLNVVCVANIYRVIILSKEHLHYSGKIYDSIPIPRNHLDLGIFKIVSHYWKSFWIKLGIFTMRCHIVILTLYYKHFKCNTKFLNCLNSNANIPNIIAIFHQYLTNTGCTSRLEWKLEYFSVL